jgi:hypothetical protein
MIINDILKKYFLKIVDDNDPYYPYWGDEKFDSDVYKTTKWFTTDSLLNYIKNGNKKYSINDIIYNINENGFRINPNSLENENKDIIACFGCSHTFGVGLPWDQTWVNNLNELLDHKYEIKNYGISGASNDNISRMIYNYTLNNKPKIICCYFPEMTRVELVDEKMGYLWNYTDNFLSMTFNCNGTQDNKFKDDIEKIKENQKENFYAYKTIYKEKNCSFNFIKNFKFIEMLCKIHDIKFYWGTWSCYLTFMSDENIKKYFNMETFIGIDSSIFNENDYARDNIHLGELSNKKIANKFYSKIIKS